MDCPPLDCSSDPPPYTEPPTTPKPGTAPPTTQKPDTVPPTTKKPDTVPPTTPKPSTCGEKSSTAQECIATMSSCASCIDDAYDAMFQNSNSISCSEYVVGMCPAIARECDCGDCRQYLEDVSSVFRTNLELLFLHVYFLFSSF
jgi:hypothetical protein